ncbi:MAG: hypothetical protein JWO51_385 [Rhodospirillales bacterium]|nr:hypothetical protein [Rhodospirillales bacterium]
MTSKPNPGSASRFAAFCAAHQAECSQMVRGLLVGSAIVLALVAFMMRALNAHPLPEVSADLIGSAAYGGFDAMAWPGIATTTEQPPLDADAIVSGMLLAITLITGAFASIGFLVDCTLRAGAIAYRLSTGRKLPEAEGGD